MQIAVLTDDQSHITGFEKGGIVKVFTKTEEDSWICEKELIYTMEEINSPEEFRSYLEALCNWMAPCKILAAEKFRGTYRVVFERFQIAMWEMEGFSNMPTKDFLDNILQFYTQENEFPEYESSPQPRSAQFIELHTGYFFIDLTDVMAHKTTMNSRQILLPFFQDAKFNELEIICSHVPKWFADELSQLNLKYEEEICEDKIKVKVF